MSVEWNVQLTEESQTFPASLPVPSVTDLVWILPSLQAQAFLSDFILSSYFQVILYPDLLAIMLSTFLVLQSVLHAPASLNLFTIFSVCPDCMLRWQMSEEVGVG